MSEQDNLIIFKNLVFELAIRVASLEKILIDKKILSLEDIANNEDQITDEALKEINGK